ncbi:MAG: TolC family protein [Bacteroidales bacterium]|nr:TolC family protein [Bacteroidales bacterium]
MTKYKKQYRETIQKAYYSAKGDYASYTAYKSSLEAAQEAFGFARERYDNGAMSMFDFNEMKNKVALAQAKLPKCPVPFCFSAKVLDFYAGKAIEL